MSIQKPMLIHLPHSSLYVPEDVRSSILLSDTELEQEMLMLTDRYTDELFDFPSIQCHKNMVNRIIFDPERFRSDSDEVMAGFGMGALYTRTLDGRTIRRLTDEQREELLRRFYDPYHLELGEKVQKLLEGFEKCLILDGHSFPQVPLAVELDKNPDRPDICVGTSEFHTPGVLSDLIEAFVRRNGMSVKFNSPFAGTMVPMKYYLKDKGVMSVMIEINRKLYMNEETGEKGPGFDAVKDFIHGLIREILKVL